ncbi:MAG TPA: SGNH hydrolase domain-containing protein, partial [Acidimicrobiales bacterium]|nr:SGNH hydrolase domain-containing protein [Acidimicrobiales bacterium]
FLVRTAATIAVATVSFYLVERPIRQGTFFRQWRAWVVTPVAVAATAVVLVAATAVPAVAVAGGGRRPPHSPTTLPGVPVKVLLVGDSTALTLGLGLSAVMTSYGITLADEGIIGCGITVGAEWDTEDIDRPFPQPCNSRPAPPGTPLLKTTVSVFGTVKAPVAERWTAWDSSWVDKFDPNVVMVLAGRWETVDRTYRGKWTNILHPAYAAYVKRQLQRTVDLMSAQGARVVLLTAPCYDTGEQPDGQPWPTNSPQRLAVYNRLVREVAAEDPGTAAVVDLHGMVCPDGKYQQTIDGVQVRQPDGIHFTIPGGEILAPKILPTVVRLGREQMADGRAASVPAGGSTGTPP